MHQRLPLDDIPSLVLVLLHAENLAKSVNHRHRLVHRVHGVVGERVHAEKQVVDHGKESEAVTQVDLFTHEPLRQKDSQNADHSHVLEEREA